MLNGLASGVKGMVGLGRTQISLPSQFSAAFRFSRKFAICLSSSTTTTIRSRDNGVIFFGRGPYFMFPIFPDKDVSESLSYTPLIFNPVSTASVYQVGDPSSEYFIGLKSIEVNGKAIPLNATLLSINKNGYGGTKISTLKPYTVMETTIYKTVIEAFVKHLADVPRVASVAPFGACFSSKNISSTRVGWAVPQIDLLLHGKSRSVYWTIFGANSMVQVNNDVTCLGFVDGGSNPRTSIVIGGYQLEDNLVELDIAKSRLGFSNSLLFQQTTCANFNFTSNA